MSTATTSPPTIEDVPAEPTTNAELRRIVKKMGCSRYGSSRYRSCSRNLTLRYPERAAGKSREIP